MVLRTDQTIIVQSTTAVYCDNGRKKDPRVSVTWEIRTDFYRTDFWVLRLFDNGMTEDIADTESASSARDALHADISSYTRNRDMVIESDACPVS